MFSHDFHFGFGFVDPDQPAPVRLTAIGVETDWDRTIIHENASRPIYTYIFLHTLSGCGCIELEDGCHHNLPVGQSSLLFMPSSTRFYTSPQSDVLWRYYYIMFIVDKMTKPYCNKIDEISNHIISLSPSSLSLQSAVDLITRRRNGLICHSSLAFAAIYDFLCKLYYDVTTQNPNHSILVQSCLNIMDERYSKLNGIQELSDTLGFSQEHITRTFTKEVHMSPIKYLTKLRLKNSLPLLSNTNMPIHDIAIACGFESGSYFSKVFKKEMCISPSSYRQNYLAPRGS